MRSAREIRFRLAQQIANVRLLALPPARPKNLRVAHLPLPDGSNVADFLRGTLYAREIELLAKGFLAHRFPLLGLSLTTGPSIEWRRDYVNARTTEASYFRLIPYLDFEKAGDHKNIWELSRHQHLVLLAQAFLLTGHEAYRAEIVSQLQSWQAQNPFVKGINWASALEVAFRVLSWLWIDHLAGAAFDTEARTSLWDSLYRHGCYLEHNLSTYFSPNTHLLGEGVALHALGLKFPSTKWRALGARIVHEELQRQVRSDGSHFEQSTYYHVYALDFFQFHYVLAGRPATLINPLRKMARFLAALNGPDGQLSFLGDDDGGRLFHPYGERSRFGRATLATSAALFPQDGFPVSAAESHIQKAWWVGAADLPASAPSESTLALFPASGIAAITRPGLHILIDAGPFGPGGAGHSHSDTLSLTIRSRSQEILIDPGTFTYVADPQLRNAFRGSSAHNTLRLDNRDQADPVKPFRWENKPEVNIRQWVPSEDSVLLDAQCAYRAFTHRRRFLLVGTSALFILDEVTGPPGEHNIEQFWHAGEPVSTLSAMRLRIGETLLLFCAPASPMIQQGWRSRAFAEKSEAPVISLSWRALLPQMCATAFLFDQDPEVDLHLERQGPAFLLTIPGAFTIHLPETGIPTITRS